MLRYILDIYLLYIPRIKHKNWEIRNNRIYLIFHHDNTIEKLIRWLFKKTYVSDLELDELGSKIWPFIDGIKTVYEIAKKMRNCMEKNLTLHTKDLRYF